ncbi:hypothetical protein IWQ60_011753 [Tieghemiomyces parasiticus]|uniref:Uncharacterized protein n=1 Tax=Tieghemiomyces parasiticus TaxID=78921 RepID=A0A9W8DI59_9FUNG|nr:hypothetical protein IWQ60_011753 [Tieghemiomyces parasiticus]
MALVVRSPVPEPTVGVDNQPAATNCSNGWTCTHRQRRPCDDLTEARRRSLEDRLTHLQIQTQQVMADLEVQCQNQVQCQELNVTLRHCKQRAQEHQIRLIRCAERLQEARRLADGHRDALRHRRHLLALARRQAHREQSYLNDSLVTLEQNRIIMEASATMRNEQLANYMRGLQYLFPITTDPDSAGTYRICRLPTPTTADKVPLRYPIKFLSSRSVIYNPCADMMRVNIRFPLYLYRNEWDQFNYAYSLLSQNMHQLLSAQGIDYYEPRNILANLKLLLDIIETRGSGGIT